MPFFAGARVLNRPHSITAEVEIPEQGAEGVLLAQGTSAGGFTLYVKDRRLNYAHNWVGREQLELTSDAEVTAGRHKLRYEFEPQGPPDPAKGHGAPGRFQLYIDDELVGTRDVPYTTLVAFNPGAITCGADPGSTVSDDYKPPFRFTGTLHKVTVDLSGELISDPEAEAQAPPGAPIAQTTIEPEAPRRSPVRVTVVSDRSSSAGQFVPTGWLLCLPSRSHARLRSSPVRVRCSLSRRAIQPSERGVESEKPRKPALSDAACQALLSADFASASASAPVRLDADRVGLADDTFFTARVGPRRLRVRG